MSPPTLATAAMHYSTDFALTHRSMASSAIRRWYTGASMAAQYAGLTFLSLDILLTELGDDAQFGIWTMRALCAASGIASLALNLCAYRNLKEVQRILEPETLEDAEIA